MVSPTRLRELWTDERAREMLDSFAKVPADKDIIDTVAYIANYWGSSPEEAVMAVFLYANMLGKIENWLGKEAEVVKAEGQKEPEEGGRGKAQRRRAKKVPEGDQRTEGGD